ncbi:uncharacterized protein LOC141687352 isoform X2 [Apium graveolens]|uniref:uncharacterized protein LOC141687352 isoform X2 n=1 Tax=Apium graveolens TaxID=4045 RepID=UPI003D7BC1DA
MIIMVLPGEYRLSSFVAKLERAPELLLLPTYVDVNVNVNRPLLNVRFHQIVVSNGAKNYITQDVLASIAQVMRLRQTKAQSKS